MSLSGFEVPERSTKDRIIAAGVFTLSALYFLGFYRLSLMSGDEGIVLQGAQRILNGQVLYRDFFSFLTPGSYYWYALFFKMFGSSIIVARCVLLAETATLSTLTYLISRRACSRLISFLTAAAVTVTAAPGNFNVIHNWDSTFWASLALYFAILFSERSSLALLFAASGCTGVTCLFEQSKGAGVFVGLGAAALILARARRGCGTKWKKAAIVAALGLVLPFVATFAYFAARQAAPDMVADWLWPLQHYSAANRTSYGFVVLSPEDRATMYAGTWAARLLTVFITGPLFIIPFLPMIGVITLVSCLIGAARVHRDTSPNAYYVIVSSVIAGLFASVFAAGRIDFTHFAFISPISFIGLAWLLDGRRLPAAFRSALPVLTFVVLASCLAYGLMLLARSMNAKYEVNTRRGTLKAVYKDEVIDYVEAKVPAETTILVYPYLPLYYYLTDAYSPGPYEYLQPGLHTPMQFQELADDIKIVQPRLILFEPAFREKLRAGFPSTPTSVADEPDPVARYIRSHYKTCAQLTSAQQVWTFLAMVPTDSSCP